MLLKFWHFTIFVNLTLVLRFYIYFYFMRSYVYIFSLHVKTKRQNYVMQEMPIGIYFYNLLYCTSHLKTIDFITNVNAEKI